MRHREQIQSFLAHSSTAIGAGETMLARNLDSLKTILQEIEALHQKAFLKDGHLRSPEFFAERKNLLARLDTHLTSLTRRSAGIPDHPNLKTALGISSRSLVHRWTQAGAPGQIPGYASHIQQLAKASTVIKHGGWVGTAIGGGASYMKVKNVCSAGNDEACEKITFTETGSFVGSLGGWGLGGGGTINRFCRRAVCRVGHTNRRHSSFGMRARRRWRRLCRGRRPGRSIWRMGRREDLRDR